jgi:branched-subunit amino acid aminotransferase/4-amino-4-deoxychorismate lyase
VSGVPIRVEVNGRMATAEHLQHPALVNYGHFTAMQVRNGRTRGLDLHLDRLDAATRHLFGANVDTDLIRNHVRHALGDTGSASVRVTISTIAMYDGTTVTWPEAPNLAGITMQLLQSRLDNAGLTTRQAPVRLTDLPSFTAAFLTNSLGVAPVGQIDATRVAIDPGLMKTVTGIYESVRWDRSDG